MARVLLALILSLMLSACFSEDTSIYDTRMGEEPWSVAQARQADIAKLSDDEQKLIRTLVTRLRIVHSETGYPEPNRVFREALRAQYGAQFEQVLEKARRAEQEAQQAEAAR